MTDNRDNIWLLQLTDPTWKKDFGSIKVIASTGRFYDLNAKVVDSQVQALLLQLNSPIMDESRYDSVDDFKVLRFTNEYYDERKILTSYQSLELFCKGLESRIAVNRRRK